MSNICIGITLVVRVSGTAAPGPINTVAPVISGTPEVGQTLTSTTGTWTGTGTITYAYQWRRNGENIGSATASTYEVQVADEGADITCRVTATDDLGSRGANSNALSVPAAPSTASALLLVSGDNLLLMTGDKLLLSEAA
jgi:hypothetical protein